jgi:hypothetical protein
MYCWPFGEDLLDYHAPADVKAQPSSKFPLKVCPVLFELFDTHTSFIIMSNKGRLSALGELFDRRENRNR